ACLDLSGSPNSCARRHTDQPHPAVPSEPRFPITQPTVSFNGNGWPHSLQEKNDQRRSGRQMQQDMRSVGDHSIAHRQEGMRLAEHNLITRGSQRFRPEKIRDPPGADLPNEEQAVADHEPVVKPVGISSSKMQQAKAQPDGPRYALNERHGDQTACRILAAYCCHIVKASKRNPVVNPEKKNLKHLESEQDDLDFAACRETLLCPSPPPR